MNSAKLGPYTIYSENGEEYHRIKREVWGANNYYVEIDKDNPVIIDAGAHIGIATLYFKKVFPKSEIVAIEPFPQNAELFRKNMYENQVEGVTLEEVALGESVGERELFYDATDNEWYSTASFNAGAWTGDQTSKSMKVKTQKLSYYLEKYKPDLVKMDIEGAEERVLLAAKNVIGLCPHYLIEFHPIEGKGMERIVRLFEELGYTITVTKNGSITPWQKAVGMSLISAQVLA